MVRLKPERGLRLKAGHYGCKPDTTKQEEQCPDRYSSRLRSRVALFGAAYIGSVRLQPDLEAAQQKPAGPLVEVFKTPTCGCCSLWVEHMRKNGFNVRTTDMNDLSEIKKSRGVPDQVQSCHTAVVNGYVVEGHVPAADVHRMLKEKPAIAGIAVGGMPVGSPGMDYPGTKPSRTTSCHSTRAAPRACSRNTDEWISGRCWFRPSWRRPSCRSRLRFHWPWWFAATAIPASGRRRDTRKLSGACTTYGLARAAAKLAPHLHDAPRSVFSSATAHLLSFSPGYPSSATRS